MKQILTKRPMFILSGEIIHGRGIGKLVGMPTANLQPFSKIKLPPVGVYITKILLNSQTYYGITNIGTRPTIDNDKEISIETHILNFNKDIYGEKIEIQLFDRLRAQQKFENYSMLLNQIRKDCSTTRDFFGIAQIFSPLYMDFANRRVKIANQEVCLSAKEFDVLYMLYSNPDIVFTKEQLYEAIWHESANGCCHAVENTIFQVRKKLKLYSAGYEFIKTVVGYGYKFTTR